MANRYGLSRDIPEPVKRLVRQRCGYGCVVCGGAIIEYEHIEPEFADAKEHNPTAIALLCPGCHGKVTRGFMAKSTVLAAVANPKVSETGFANELFDFGEASPALVFAGMTIRNTPIPIEVRGIPLFQIAAPEGTGAPFRLSGHFQNSRGERSLDIVENEWRPHAGNWDVEAAGGVISIRDGPGQISLRLRANPPHGLVVERLDMRHSGYRFIGNADTLVVESAGGGRNTFTRCVASNCHVGLSLG